MPELPITHSGKPAFLLYSLLVLYACVLVAGVLFIKREEFNFLLAWQLVLHGCFFLAFKFRNFIPLTHLIWAALLMRFILAFTTPTLSEDVYRFVWDGQLILRGDNPMLSTPDSYLAAIGNSSPTLPYFTSLHGLINHPQYYTCYPPLMQGVFWLSAVLGFKSIGISVFVIKLALTVADGFTIYFLIKILKRLKLDAGFSLLYALHPLVMVEGSGNAHFEVMQATFISGSIFFLLTKKAYTAAVFWGLAIATKLLPLMLLPLLWFHLGLKKGFWFCCISVVIVIFSFLPFLTMDALYAFSTSLNLFIQQFEFNASIYYILRAFGYWATGYNQVAILGPALIGLFLSIYALILLKKRKFDFNSFIKIAITLFTLYFLFSTTVHPWYIITLLPFAVISRSYFAVVWMSAVFLSYNAYTGNQVHENPWLILLEYGLVAIVFLIEWRYKKTVILHSIQSCPEPK